MTNIKRLAGRGFNLLAALAFTIVAAAPILVSESVYAAGTLSPRKLTQSSQALGTISTDANGTAVAAGSGGNGAKTKHTFDFTLATGSGNLGSIALQYCTTPLYGTTCTTPTGLDASTVASIVAQTGLTAAGFTIDTTTNATTTGFFATTNNACASATGRVNCILIKRASASSQTGTGPVQLAFGQGGGTDWIKNPTVNGDFYVRITTFSDNTYTTVVDQGVVAGNVNTNIDITAKVQEKLNFSVSGVYSAPTASCVALSGSGAINLGDPVNGLLDPATAYDAFSYFRLNTNATGGSTVYYSGDTLKSGANSITAAGTTKVNSAPGTSQFGLALDTGNVNHSFTNLAATTNYSSGSGNINPAVAAQFAYDTGSMTVPVAVATVAATPVTCDTGVVRYVGNASTTTKPGIYKTTVSYIAVPTF